MEDEKQVEGLSLSSSPKEDDTCAMSDQPVAHEQEKLPSFKWFTGSLRRISLPRRKSPSTRSSHLAQSSTNFTNEDQNSLASTEKTANSSHPFMSFFKRKVGVGREHKGGIHSRQNDCSLVQKQIFTMAELEAATNNFDEDVILGRGSCAKVYRGVLDDGRFVAIKRCMEINQHMVKEFQNEVLIHSQINHLNVVKLLGACLEVEVPILVYEFVPNGTLYQYIHFTSHEHLRTWSARLRIATEIAKALAYLHSGAQTSIIHRDVKSSHILLDVSYTTKLFGFGSSVEKEKAHNSYSIQGTMGYIDPEYLSIAELTEKCDVYSFGVVLAELLTREKALSLAEKFIHCVKNNRHLDILDAEIVDDEESLKQIYVVCDLVMRCLRLRGKERPNMIKVYIELEGLRMSGSYPYEHHYTREVDSD